MTFVPSAGTANATLRFLRCATWPVSDLIAGPLYNPYLRRSEATLSGGNTLLSIAYDGQYGNGVTAHGAEGRKSVTEAYGDWTVNCHRRDQAQSGDGPAPGFVCRMSQRLQRNETGQLVLAFVFSAPLAEKKSNAVIITPFGLRLSAGILLNVDGNSLLKAPFRTCLPSGCLVFLVLDETLIASFSRGQKATVVMTPQESDKPLPIDVSLNGFSAAHKRLDELAREFDLFRRIGGN